jgi:putative drug exporter of the RND superfamily
VGFAVAAGIAIAAFVMAMFFSPSLTALVGKRAWWPGGTGKADRDKADRGDAGRGEEAGLTR